MGIGGIHSYARYQKNQKRLLKKEWKTVHEEYSRVGGISSCEVEMSDFTEVSAKTSTSASCLTSFASAAGRRGVPICRISVRCTPSCSVVISTREPSGPMVVCTDAEALESPVTVSSATMPPLSDDGL